MVLSGGESMSIAVSGDTYSPLIPSDDIPLTAGTWHCRSVRLLCSNCGESASVEGMSAATDRLANHLAQLCAADTQLTPTVAQSQRLPQ